MVNVPLFRLFALSLFTLILYFSMSADIPVIRSLFGLPYLLLLPGYLFLKSLSVLVGKTFLQMISLSFGVSIVLLGLLGVGLNFTSWGLKPISVYISVTCLVFILAIFSTFRGRQTVTFQDYGQSFHRVLVAFIQTQPLIFITMFTSIVLILGVAGLMVWRLSTVQLGERFTEFYVLGVNGKADTTSLQLNAGKLNNLTIGIANKEQSKETYYFRVLADKVVIIETEAFILLPDQNREFGISFFISEDLSNKEINVLLYTSESQEPYRVLNLQEGDFVVVPQK